MSPQGAWAKISGKVLSEEFDEFLDALTYKLNTKLTLDSDKFYKVTVLVEETEL